MKKAILFFGILIGFMAVSSCSSDDNGSNPEPVSIVGVWKQINEIDFCSTGGQETIQMNYCQQSGRYVFNSNGTYTATFFELAGNDCLPSTTENGNWEIHDDTLHIYHTEGSYVFTTFELTQNTLRIGTEMIIPGEPCNDGHLVAYELNFVRAE